MQKTVSFVVKSPLNLYAPYVVDMYVKSIIMKDLKDVLHVQKHSAIYVELH